MHLLILMTYIAANMLLIIKIECILLGRVIVALPILIKTASPKSHTGDTD